LQNSPNIQARILGAVHTICAVDGSIGLVELNQSDQESHDISALATPPIIVLV